MLNPDIAEIRLTFSPNFPQSQISPSDEDKLRFESPNLQVLKENISPLLNKINNTSFSPYSNTIATIDPLGSLDLVEVNFISHLKKPSFSIGVNTNRFGEITADFEGHAYQLLRNIFSNLKTEDFIQSSGNLSISARGNSLFEFTGDVYGDSTRKYQLNASHSYSAFSPIYQDNHSSMYSEHRTGLNFTKFYNNIYLSNVKFGVESTELFPTMTPDDGNDQKLSNVKNSIFTAIASHSLRNTKIGFSFLKKMTLFGDEKYGSQFNLSTEIGVLNRLQNPIISTVFSHYNYYKTNLFNFKSESIFAYKSLLISSGESLPLSERFFVGGCNNFSIGSTNLPIKGFRLRGGSPIEGTNFGLSTYLEMGFNLDHLIDNLELALFGNAGVYSLDGNIGFKSKLLSSVGACLNVNLDQYGFNQLQLNMVLPVSTDGGSVTEKFQFGFRFYSG